MGTATVTEAGSRLSALIDQVRAGEAITILDRGTPVARLAPIVSRADQDGRLGRLSPARIVRLPEHTGLVETLERLPQIPTP